MGCSAAFVTIVCAILTHGIPWLWWVAEFCLVVLLLGCISLLHIRSESLVKCSWDWGWKWLRKTFCCCLVSGDSCYIRSVQFTLFSIPECSDKARLNIFFFMNCNVKCCFGAVPLAGRLFLCCAVLVVLQQTQQRNAETCVFQGCVATWWCRLKPAAGAP